jgi:hypothetical protein
MAQAVQSHSFELRAQTDLICGGDYRNLLTSLALDALPPLEHFK